MIARIKDMTCKTGSISVRLTNKAKTFNIYNFKSFILSDCVESLYLQIGHFICLYLYTTNKLQMPTIPY
jgi:hypothetical protein